jgi:hypothetical protein
LLLVFLSILLGYFEWKRLLREYALSLESQINESKANLAAQVAHDIRSPVFALDAALKSMTQLPEQQRVVVRHAVNRIRDVANGLLEKNRPRPEGSASNGAVATEAQLLSNLIEPVIAEKHLQYGDKPGIDIDCKLSRESYVLYARVQPVEFGRMLSNLINNAAEALGDKGKVDVRLALEDNCIVLTITDNGKGIPLEILSRLGQRGETHGKTGGSGLGLYHAKTTVESWGGSMNITSEPAKGTTVSIKLPKAEAPDYFVGELNHGIERPGFVPISISAPAAPGRAVLLDDDALTHMTWEMSAQEHGVELQAFTDPAEFLSRLENFPKDIPLYIDSDLGEKIKGENIAVELKEKGFINICLATAHPPGKFAHLPWLKVITKEPPWGKSV